MRRGTQKGLLKASVGIFSCLGAIQVCSSHQRQGHDEPFYQDSSRDDADITCWCKLNRLLKNRS